MNGPEERIGKVKIIDDFKRINCPNDYAGRVIIDLYKKATRLLQHEPANVRIIIDWYLQISNNDVSYSGLTPHRKDYVITGCGLFKKPTDLSTTLPDDILIPRSKQGYKNRAA